MAVRRLGRDHGGGGVDARPDHRRNTRAGRPPRGLPRRRARLAPRPGLRLPPVPARGRPAAREPRERVLRGGLGLHRDGSDRPRGRRGARPLPPLLAPVLPLARRDGDHHPRRRRAAAAPRRRSSAPPVRARRPDRARAARRDDPRDGAPPLGALRGSDGGRDPHARIPRVDGNRSRDDLLRRGRARILRDRARRLLDAERLGLDLRTCDPVGAPRLHAARRDQLPAPLPAARPAARPRRRPGRGASPLPRAHGCGFGASRRRGARRELLWRARRPCARPSSRRSRS